MPNPSDIPPHPGLHIVLVLVPGFTLSNLTVMLDLMRITNREAMETVFSWDIVTLDDTPCPSSAGLDVPPTSAMNRIRSASIVLVLASWAPEVGYVPALFAWLHSLDRRHVQIGSMENGAFILAKAGLLAPAEATPHIESRDSFSEEFHHGLLCGQLHILTDRRMGCTGIVSELDMFFALLARRHSTRLAQNVADIVSYGRPESAFLSRSLHRDRRVFRQDYRMSRCIELMQSQLEEPLTLNNIAAQARISIWQMRRLFLKELNQTPSAFYTGLRLRRARELLEHGRAPIREIALACGFSDSSSFSASFRRLHHVSPSQCRSQAIDD